MSPQLAINGGTPILKRPLPFFPPSPIGSPEKRAALRVLRAGRLSEFLAGFSDKFVGGKEVLRFEEFFENKFNIKHAISFNSATTALHGAIVALEIGPGDEVIVPPYSMSASAMAILMNGAVPIFADISDQTFCIDPQSIKSKITKRTKAIMVVNLFGRPADFKQIMAVAREHNLRVIEDNAQAPGALYGDKFTGTIGDIGVFSLNTHKVIQVGEGGILTTHNDDYALRAKLARNHGELAVDQMKEPYNAPIIGSNYRLTELQAAIAYEQVLRLDELNASRIEHAAYLTEHLREFNGIIPTEVPDHMQHVYYVYPFRITQAFGIPRDRFVDAMAAEGFSLSKGYAKPLYLLPVFQQKKVFNQTHFPFESKFYSGTPTYEKGSCPVCERLYETELSFTTVCQYPFTKKEIDLFITAIRKIVEHKKELV